MKVQVPGFSGGDRVRLDLPEVQTDLLRRIAAIGKPVVLVLMNGSAVSVNWARDHLPGIVELWYPGEAGGTALADVLFGDYNPAGRLPVTFYRSEKDLPAFDDYRMQGRTYRYFTGEPLFPFGYGLSYTSFAYSVLNVPQTVQAGAELKASVDVENTGNRAGEEVVELYLTREQNGSPGPIRSLAGFRRVFLEKGQKKSVAFTLTPKQLAQVDSDGQRVVEPGTFSLSVGGQQAGAVEGRCNVVGTTMRLE
jgi:beta-glucosidase